MYSKKNNYHTGNANLSFDKIVTALEENLSKKAIALGKYEEAMKSYFKAINSPKFLRSSHEHFFALFGIAKAQFESGEYRSARQYFERILKIRLNSSSSYNRSTDPMRSHKIIINTYLGLCDHVEVGEDLEGHGVAGRREPLAEVGVLGRVCSRGTGDP